MITVRLFSVLREKTGVDRITLDPAQVDSVEAAIELLSADYPDIARYRPWIRPALNRTYCSLHAPLATGDELSLITPVSGG